MHAALPTPLALAPGARLHPAELSGREPLLLCEVVGTGGPCARYALPERLRPLLERFDGETPTGAILREMGPGLGWSERELATLVRDLLVPRGILVGASRASPHPVRARRASPPGLLLRLPLLPAALVRAVARPLGGLFGRTGLALGVPLAALGLLGPALAGLGIAGIPAGVNLAAGALPPLPGEPGGWLLVGLVAFAALLHELGHAAAAARFGCREVGIGAGLYLWLPVLYTDVSEAWRLPRARRVVVDLGGMYFQALFGGLCALGGLLSPSPAWPWAWFGSLLAVLVNLNPVVRLDGWWILADAFGVADPRRAAVRWWRGEAQAPGERAAGRVWAALAVPGAVVLLATGIVPMVSGAARALPLEVAALGAALADEAPSVGAILDALRPVGLRTLGLGASAWGIVSLLRQRRPG